jgi:hypothetical protein
MFSYIVGLYFLCPCYCFDTHFVLLYLIVLVQSLRNYNFCSDIEVPNISFSKLYASYQTFRGKGTE